MTKRLSESGRWAEAIEVAQVAVAIEPSSENAEYALIGALIADGNRSLAVREYREFRRRLWGELRVRPSRPLGHLLGVAVRPMDAVRPGLADPKVSRFAVRKVDVSRASTRTAKASWSPRRASSTRSDSPAWIAAAGRAVCTLVGPPRYGLCTG